MWYKNIAGRFFGLVTKHTSDRRAELRLPRQDRASIAASRGKNENPYNSEDTVQANNPCSQS